MKHKLFLFFTITFICFSNYMEGQGLYFGINGGYGMSMASQVILSTTNSTSTGSGSNADFNYESIKGSYGKGINAGATVGYMINKNIGAELGFNYLIGSTYKGTNSKLPGAYTIDYTLKGKMLRLIPALRLTTSGEGKLKPFMKLGLVVGLKGKISSTENFTDLSTNKVTEKSWDYTGGVALGTAFSAGINYALNEKLSLFGEIGIISQSWAPKKSTLTKYTIDGADQLPPLTTSQTQTDYEYDYTQSSSATPNSSEPSKALRKPYAFSSWGINVGLCFSIGKKSEK